MSVWYAFRSKKKKEKLKSVLMLLKTTLGRTKIFSKFSSNCSLPIGVDISLSAELSRKLENSL